jgi:xylitol oxidase
MPDASTVRPTNWGGNITYNAQHLHLPQTVAEVSQLVRAAAKPKALGTRHTFNRIADTTGDLISVRGLDRILGLDEARQTVTVEAGITYGTLGTYLHPRGYALANLPSLPHVCIGGAVATGTHGSGTANLSGAVVALQLVTADGEVLECSRDRDGEQFDGMVVALGLLGVVTRLTLRIRPVFTIQQEVYERVPLADLLDHYAAIVASAYSVSLFNDWQGDHINQVWFKRDVTAGPPADLPFAFLTGRRAAGKRHPIGDTPPDFCTEQGVPGSSHERLPHFRADREPSSGGDELQSEFFVHRDDAADALRAVAQIGPRLSECLYVSEVRTVDEDALWLSPCYRRPSVGIHFTWRLREAEVLHLLETVVEPALARFEPRPHWGKLFTMAPADVRSQYEMLPAFRQLCGDLDPRGKFRNAFTDRLIFG